MAAEIAELAHRVIADHRSIYRLLQMTHSDRCQLRLRLSTLWRWQVVEPTDRESDEPGDGHEVANQIVWPSQGRSSRLGHRNRSPTENAFNVRRQL